MSRWALRPSTRRWRRTARRNSLTRRAAAPSHPAPCNRRRQARSKQPPGQPSPSLSPDSDIDIDDHRHVVAEARSAPGLERANAQFAHLTDPQQRHEDIIDVIGRPVLGAVAPIERGFALRAMRLAADRMVGADQAEAFLEDPDLGRVVDTPARLVPDRIAVEVARDHGRPLAEEALVARQRPSQRAQLVLADAAGTGVLRPYGQQVALGGAVDMDPRYVTPRRVIGLRQPDPAAVEGENPPALGRVAANP